MNTTTNILITQQRQRALQRARNGRATTPLVLKTNRTLEPVTNRRADLGHLRNPGRPGPDRHQTTQLDIANNTATGGTGGGNTFPGIGLRKQGTTTGEFAIVGLTPSPATNAQMEASVASRNTSTPGTFGANGVAAVNGLLQQLDVDHLRSAAAMTSEPA